MLRAGYSLLMTAGACLVGYVIYWFVRWLVAAPGIILFFKVVILVGGAGLLLTLVGLVLERRREERHARGDRHDHN